MKHKYSSIMASSLAKVVSVAAIATMTVNIIIPDHKLSETENRPLQTFPSGPLFSSIMEYRTRIIRTIHKRLKYMVL